MSKMIQIRNVPDELHGTLKARAALAGMRIRRSTERPTVSELRQRLRARRR